MDINFVTILLYMVNVLILVFAFNKWALKPVRKFMAAREERYAQRKAAIEDEEKNAKELFAQAKEELDSVGEKGQALINESRLKAKDVYDHGVDEANEKSREIVARAERDAERIRTKALQDAQSDIVDLAMDIAQRVVGKEISSADHEKMIHDVLEVK